MLFCRRVSLRALLVTGITFAALSTYLYVFYSESMAPLVHSLYSSNGGFALGLVELAIMDLALDPRRAGARLWGSRC